jgi:hypothetical protein
VRLDRALFPLVKHNWKSGLGNDSRPGGEELKFFFNVLGGSESVGGLGARLFALRHQFPLLLSYKVEEGKNIYFSQLSSLFFDFHKS